MRAVWLPSVRTLPVTSVSPACSAIDVATDTDLEFTFDDPISFDPDTDAGLRLYAAGDRTHPVWSAAPKPGHPAEGSRTLVFDDLPTLMPNTTYFAISDPGWIHIGNRPAGPINDGAFWYRFRTRAAAQP